MGGSWQHYNTPGTGADTVDIVDIVDSVDSVDIGRLIADKEEVTRISVHCHQPGPFIIITADESIKIQTTFRIFFAPIEILSTLLSLCFIKNVNVHLFLKAAPSTAPHQPAIFFAHLHGCKTSTANFFARGKTADDNLIMSNDNW